MAVCRSSSSIIAKTVVIFPAVVDNRGLVYVRGVQVCIYSGVDSSSRYEHSPLIAAIERATVVLVAA
jgi:hypothetical protein